MEELKTFEKKYNNNYPIQLTEENYQHLIDISDMGIAIANQKLLYSIKILVLEFENFSILQLISIPKTIGNVFLPIIPEHEFLMFNEQKTLYVQTDNKESINNYKNLDVNKICKHKQPSYLVSATHTCDRQIIRRSAKSLGYNFCQMSPFKIYELVYIQLNGEKG